MRQGLFTVLLVTACQISGEPDRVEAAGSVSVDLVFGDLGVKVARVYPAEQFPITHFRAPAMVRYQLLDASGDPVVAGILPDTRWAYGEAHDDAGVPYRKDVRFEQGYVSVRLPAVAGTLVLSEPRETGAVELGRVAFDPAAAGTGAASARLGSSTHALAEDDDVLGEPVVVHGGASPVVKLLILPEGYTEAEMPLFEQRTAEIVHDLLATRDYADFAGAFQILRQNVRSAESGLQGETGDDIDSAFELETSDACPEFGGPRSWFGLGGSKGEDLARDLGEKAGANVTIVLVNHEEPMTACARERLVVLGTDQGGRVLAHELGHSLFNLGDEYVAWGGTVPPICHVLGWFGAREAPNITSDGDSPPWWDLVTPGTPLPTPPDYEKYRESVGAFEGAQGCWEGYYRPAITCMMDNSNSSDFCPVCRREVERVFDALGQQPEPDDPACPKKWRDDGICDPCLGDDPDCGSLRCDVDGLCDLTIGEGCGTCPEDCGACVKRGCGDGQCAEEETDTCAEDCGCRADFCQAEVAPFGCWCDAACEGRGDCCWDAELCSN